MKKVFIIGDTHFPFHNKEAYKKVLNRLKVEKPDVVIQIGDLLDQYVFSKYTKSVKITPQLDFVKGLAMAKKMWEDVQNLLPKAKCYQILGNHDIRLAKRIAEKLPELSEIISHRNYYVFPNVQVMRNDRDYLTIDGVVYCHGWLGMSIDHAVFFGKPTVHGHRHRMEIATKGKLWSMDVGYLADSKSIPLNYTASRFSLWTTGCGIVENGKPRLVFL